MNAAIAFAAGCLAATLAWAAPGSGTEQAPVRFAPERDYGPFVFVDERGQVAGLSVEMLSLVQRQTGLPVQTLPAAPLKEQLQRARQGEADLLSSLRPTPERGAYLLFSAPYVSVPAIVVGRADSRLELAEEAPADALMASLIGRTVAVGEGYGVEAFVRSRYPAVRWQAVTDDVQGLRGVAEGRFDAAVLDAASAAFIKQHHRMSGLQRWGTVGFEYALSFAVPRARPELLERLNEGIRAIPRHEAQAVVARWMRPIEDDDFFRRHRGATAAGLAGLGLALLGVGGLVVSLQRRRGGDTPRSAE